MKNMFRMFSSFGMFGKRRNIIPTSWTTILFSDGNDLVFSDGNNLGYGA